MNEEKDSMQEELQPEEQKNREAEQALDARERELNQRELRLLAGEELLKRGLSRDIAPLIDYTDRDKCLQSLDRLERVISSEAAKLSDRRLGRYALPGGAAAVDSDSLSDREYYQMTMR